MLKPALALALVASMYGLFWFGQARGSESMLANAQAAYADYEDALAHAQREYDALQSQLSAEIGRLGHDLEVEQDTREYWRGIADEKAAEASRYRSLAAFRGGEAY